MYHLYEPDYPSDDEINAQYVSECKDYADKHFRHVRDVIQALLDELFIHDEIDEERVDAAAHYLASHFGLVDYVKEGYRMNKEKEIL